MMKIDPHKYFIDDQKECSSPEKKFNAKEYVPGIPLPWVKKMFKTTFAGVRVGMICWRAFRMQGSENPFKLTDKKYREPFGISRNQKYRGLQALKKVGLIEIEQAPGVAPMITLLDIKK